MPSYQYECTACGKTFEAQQSFEEHDQHVDHERHKPLQCPHCNSKKVEQRVGSSVFVITSKKS
jgi:putative FmdB family regulatory protein